MPIKNVFRDFKNTTVSHLSKKFVNRYIKEYGEIVNVNIDSKNKNIELEVLLRGE